MLESHISSTKYRLNSLSLPLHCLKMFFNVGKLLKKIQLYALFCLLMNSFTKH